MSPIKFSWGGRYTMPLKELIFHGKIHAKIKFQIQQRWKFETIHVKNIPSQVKLNQSTELFKWKHFF